MKFGKLFPNISYACLNDDLKLLVDCFMRNFLLIFLIFIQQPCLSQIQNKDDTIPFADSLFNGIGYSEKDCEISVDMTEKYDSAQYNIIRIYYTSGQLLSESYTDSLMGTEYQEIFYPNGCLASEGTMKVDGNYHIGLWKYYYPDGKAKVFNFDSTEQTSYSKAIEIAKSYGYRNGRLEVREELLDKTYYWKVTNWIREESGQGWGKFILIRRSNGKVTIPEDNLTYYIE